jgi:hypothetical protein
LHTTVEHAQAVTSSAEFGRYLAFEALEWGPYHSKTQYYLARIVQLLHNANFKPRLSFRGALVDITGDGRTDEQKARDQKRAILLRFGVNLEDVEQKDAAAAERRKAATNGDASGTGVKS